MTILCGATWPRLRSKGCESMSLAGVKFALITTRSYYNPDGDDKISDNPILVIWNVYMKNGAALIFTVLIRYMLI